PRPMGRGVYLGAVFMAAVAPSLPALDEGQKKSLRLIADDIVKKQRADGSWELFLSRPPINESQATDAAWIIMALQSETGAERAEIKRGIDFLVATQKADGSWPMKSRATPDGKRGSVKLLTPITCGAGSWATLGLARLVAKVP